MSPQEILAATVLAKAVYDQLAQAAKDSGYTQADIDKADADRKAAIDELKKAAGKNGFEYAGF